MASTTNSSSPPLFSGTPAIILDSYVWEDTFDDTLADALAKAVDLTNHSLQSSIKDDKDWAPFADRLYVRLAKDGGLELMVTGTPEEIQEVEDLEYGTIETPARPFVRTFMHRQADIFMSRIDILLAQEEIAAHA
jgi:hypothetical protein